MSANLLVPDAGDLDCIPGYRRLRLFLYAPRPDIINFKTKQAEWRMLQSRWRFLHALYPYMGPPSYLFRQVFIPVLLPVLIALGCAMWDHYGDYTLNRKTVYARVFRLTSFCMSLLLAFRVNRVYDRWWVARGAFSGVGTGCVSLMRQDEIQRWGLLCHFAVQQCVLDMREPDKRAVAMMSDSEVRLWNISPKPRQLVMTKMALLLRELGLGNVEMLSMMSQLHVVEANHHTCARIHYTAIPYAITLHCTGFVVLYCLMLPFCLYPGGGFSCVFVTLVAAVLLLGTDEVANQLENPFRHLPIEDILITTLRDLPRVRDEMKLMREICPVARRTYAEGTAAAASKAAAAAASAASAAKAAAAAATTAAAVATAAAAAASADSAVDRG